MILSLTRRCWASDVYARPTFREIVGLLREHIILRKRHAAARARADARHVIGAGTAPKRSTRGYEDGRAAHFADSSRQALLPRSHRHHLDEDDELHDQYDGEEDRLTLARPLRSFRAMQRSGHEAAPSPSGQENPLRHQDNADAAGAFSASSLYTSFPLPRGSISARSPQTFAEKEAGQLPRIRGRESLPPIMTPTKAPSNNNATTTTTTTTTALPVLGDMHESETSVYPKSARSSDGASSDAAFSSTSDGGGGVIKMIGASDFASVQNASAESGEGNGTRLETRRVRMHHCLHRLKSIPVNRFAAVESLRVTVCGSVQARTEK